LAEAAFLKRSSKEQDMTFGIGRPDFPEGCAVIFGGSGGLGSATARLMAERGSNVVITYSGRAEAAAEVVADIESAGQRGLALQCTVEDRASIDTVINKAAAEFGRIHTVLSSQAAKYDTGPFAEASVDGLRVKFERDVIGFLNIAQASIPELRKGGGGSMIAMVSPVIKKFSSGYGLGVTPKAAVATMVKYFAGEEGQHGIRVNCVAPGLINAGLALELAKGPAKAILDRALSITPLARMGEAAEISETIAFLASSKGGFITGQMIIVDGGFSL
jgi:3-oxoacyl-[acyl-carrier protein] reductase